MGAAIGGARCNHTFADFTCRAVWAAMVARATVIKIGLGIVVDAAAVGISEALAADAVKTVGTRVTACTAVIDVRQNIGHNAVTDLHVAA